MKKKKFTKTQELKITKKKKTKKANKMLTLLRGSV